MSVGKGDFVAIVGPSGCGKRTTLNVLAGLTDLTQGEVLLAGQAPSQTKLDIGYVFQQDSVLPWKNVLDNIELGLVLRGVSAQRRRENALQLVEVIGLNGFETSYPNELSGDMRKRVALAMTLAYDPVILLMDEPIGALDAQARIILQDELLKLWHERRQTVLFVTHDIGEAITMADKVIVMTARPATIKTEYDIDLPRPRSAADVWFDRRFAEIYKAIWNDLRPEIDRQTHIGGQP